MEAEAICTLEVVEGDEPDHKVILKAGDIGIADLAGVEETIKTFIRQLFASDPEIKIRFGKTLNLDETRRFIQSRTRI